LILVALGPVSVVSLWRKGVDTLWWVGSVGGVVACSRRAPDRRGRSSRASAGWAGPPGLDPLRIGPLNRFMRTDAFAKLHGVFGMLAHPGRCSARRRSG
jgi:hypothetical protein